MWQVFSDSFYNFKIYSQRLRNYLEASLPANSRATILAVLLQNSHSSHHTTHPVGDPGEGLTHGRRLLSLSLRVRVLLLVVNEKCEATRFRSFAAGLEVTLNEDGITDINILKCSTFFKFLVAAGKWASRFQETLAPFQGKYTLKYRKVQI